VLFSVSVVCCNGFHAQNESSSGSFGQTYAGLQRRCARHGAVHHHAALTGSPPLRILRVVAVDVGAAVMQTVVSVSTVLGSIAKGVCYLCLQFQYCCVGGFVFKQHTLCHTISVRMACGISSG
jgi:hypothetical protein